MMIKRWWKNGLSTREFEQNFGKGFIVNEAKKSFLGFHKGCIYRPWNPSVRMDFIRTNEYQTVRMNLVHPYEPIYIRTDELIISADEHKHYI